jgi:hypothetical protein
MNIDSPSLKVKICHYYQVWLLCLISLTPSSIKNYLKIPFVLCKNHSKKHFLKLLLYFTKHPISFVLEDIQKNLCSCIESFYEFKPLIYLLRKVICLPSYLGSFDTSYIVFKNVEFQKKTQI